MNKEAILRRRIRLFTWLFIVGVVMSGLTAIPLETELDWLLRLLGAASKDMKGDLSFVGWLWRVREALHQTNLKYPFIAYGFDWLAFGHLVIAIAFIGALRDPIRNVWLYEFAMIACVLVIPWALIFGAVRGIPIGWRLIDCSFAVFGIIPPWLCRKWIAAIEFAGR